MQYFPHRKNKHAQLAVILLFCFSLAAMLVSTYIPLYPAIWQLSALAAAVAAILLIQKFLLTNYLYVLTDPERLDRTNTFAVIRVLGHKRSTVAKLDLNDAFALVPAHRTESVLKERGLRTTNRGSFCVDLFSPEAWTVLTAHGDEVLAMTFQAEPFFIEELKRRIPPQSI